MSKVFETLKSNRIWLAGGLALLAILLPIWLGPFPPLYDYPNHLLEAQVAAQYNNPALAYAESYRINPEWYWRSNALSTLMLIGLAKVIPIFIAGQLVLSLYLVLFWLGMGLILKQNKTRWPLLLLAPILAYSFAFTSGWINFSYGVSLSLLTLFAFLKWQEGGKYRYLALAGLLMVLIYMAHLLIWVLLIMIMSAMLKLKPFGLQYYGWFYMALYGAIFMLAP